MYAYAADADACIPHNGDVPFYQNPQTLSAFVVIRLIRLNP